MKNRAFTEGCMTLPDPAAPPSTCPVINFSPLLHAAAEKLRAQNVELNATGLGPCGRLQGPYEDWNMSIGVRDWKHAQTAVEVVAGLLRQYDLRGDIGVAVRGIGCVTFRTDPTFDPNKNPKKILERCKPARAPSRRAKLPGIASLSPGSAWVRFSYQSKPGHKPKRMQLRTKGAEIDWGAVSLRPIGWTLRIPDLESPALKHAPTFALHFEDASPSQAPLQTGSRPTAVVSLDIPSIEHGAQCRLNRRQGSMKIVQTNGKLASGVWRGKVQLQPHFYAPNEKPKGSVFTLEAVVFRDLPVR